MHRRRSLAAPIVVTVASAGLMVLTSCGGEVTSSTPGTSDAGPGGSGGSSAAGGTTSQGGSAGSAASGGSAGSECPAEPPSNYSCPAGLPADGCTYPVSCVGGVHDLTFSCAGRDWTVSGAPCQTEYDSCANTDLFCAQGRWGILDTSVNPPPPCPNTLPEPLAECPFVWETGGAICSYPCPDPEARTWGECRDTGLSGQWFFDGACEGDCSPMEEALLELVWPNRECESDSDCQRLGQGCSSLPHHCSGVFYVNTSIDAEEFAAREAMLRDCRGSQNCGGCDAIPPLAECISGRCIGGGGS